MRSLKGPWIEEYVAHIERASESSTSYHFWSAATLIGASIKRHAWLDRVVWKLYPNIFTILVGRPGVGKGAAVNPALDILREANTANVLSDRITIEYVLEKLSKGFPSTATGANGGLSFGVDATCLLYAPELSVFITTSDNNLQILSDLWDARPGKTMYGTRHKGDWPIENPCPSMLAGSSPDWLVSSIPTSAVGGGFTRRVNFVFASEKRKSIPFPESYPGFAGTRQKLVDDLRYIATHIQGEFKLAPGARALFRDYYEGAKPSEFDDEAVTAYVMSKWVQATKLAMVLTASRDDSMEITKAIFQEAIDHVDAVAAELPKVFRAMGESDLASATDRILRFVETAGYASRKQIVASNWRHIDSGNLDVVLRTLVEGGVLAESRQGQVLMYSAVVQNPNVVPKGVVVP